MASRRQFLTAAAATVASPAQTSAGAVLYAATGPTLTSYSLNVDAATLTPVGSVTLPDNVQEAWPHPSRRFLYVGWSNNAAGERGHHGITAFAVDPASGALRPHGDAVTVSARMVFLTLDIPGRYLIAAYNQPSSATVHTLESDGRIGAAVPQPDRLDFGVYAHQVRMAPSNRMVVVVTRGNGPTASRKEDPGALKVFGFRAGRLTNRASIAPGGGFNFQPRHLEFHPTLPVAYITLERQNKLQAFRVEKGESLGTTSIYTQETLRDPRQGSRQATSSIHAHPNGRFLYLANRGPATGENTIAVYALAAATGEPTLIQNADTHGVHPRTFAIDPSGRLLVVANMEAGSEPANLALFRIGGGGKLDFVRKYNQDTNGGKATLFWTGILALG